MCSNTDAESRHASCCLVSRIRGWGDRASHYEGRSSLCRSVASPIARRRLHRRRNHDRLCHQEVRPHGSRRRWHARRDAFAVDRSHPAGNAAEPGAHRRRSMPRPTRSASGPRMPRPRPRPPIPRQPQQPRRSTPSKPRPSGSSMKWSSAKIRAIQIRIGRAARGCPAAHRPDDRGPEGKSARATSSRSKATLMRAATRP